jgi:hypothetical protein
VDFKSAVVEDVQRHFRITSFWYGGYVPNAFEKWGIKLPDVVSRSCSFIYLAAQGKVPELLYLNRDGWLFSRGAPKDINFDEEEESIVEFENDGVDSDVPVEEDDRIPFSDSDGEYEEPDNDKDSDYEP